MARRNLKDHFTLEGKLQQEYQAEYAKYTPIRDDLMKLYRVKSVVDTARRRQE